jgi:hypothetical protein
MLIAAAAAAAAAAARDGQTWSADLLPCSKQCTQADTNVTSTCLQTRVHNSFFNASKCANL